MKAVRAAVRELLDRAGAGDVLGQVQIVGAGRLGGLGDQAGGVVGRGAQHGELARQMFSRLALGDVRGDLGDLGARRLERGPVAAAERSMTVTS